MAPCQYFSALVGSQASRLHPAVYGDYTMAENLTQTRSIGPPPPTAHPSKWRLALAFLVAAVSDVVSYATAFVPPVQWAVDLVTALLLFVLLGRRWAILPGLVAEAIPGVAVFPVWLLVVTSVVLWGEISGTALSRQQ